MQQQAVVLLVYKNVVFKLASSCGSIFAKVLLGIFGVLYPNDTGGKNRMLMIKNTVNSA